MRDLVLAHKERGVLALGRPLGRLLGIAATGVVEDVLGDRARVSGPPPPLPLLLVPVPSRPDALRERGHDPTWTLVRRATALLPPVVRPVPLRLLHSRGGVADQAGLGAEARAANLAGSMACRPAVLSRLARREPQVLGVVVCDDVLTTGSTLLEAQRALAAVGLPVLGGACVAATRRRLAP